MLITVEQKEKLKNIGAARNLRFLILHGSLAKGMSRPGSDIDIAIVGKNRISREDFLRIYGELADIFGDSPNQELDLKTLHGVDAFFRYEVVRDGELLYGDSNDYEEFRAYAYRDYMDSRDLRELEFTLLKKSIRSLTKHYAP